MSDNGRVAIAFTQPDGSVRSIAKSPGASVMETAIEHEIAGIEAQCYGAGVCGTCHVYVDEPWLAATGSKSDWEQAMLDVLPLARANSRLSCQIKLSVAIAGAHFTIPERQESLE
jgi:ferredoxin, 2Fe-2S